MKSPYFRHGELSQRIDDELREREEIAAADVAVRAMRDKGLDPDNDPATSTDFVRRVAATGRHAAQGRGGAYRQGAVALLAACGIAAIFDSLGKLFVILYVLCLDDETYKTYLMDAKSPSEGW